LTGPSAAVRTCTCSAPTDPAGIAEAIVSVTGVDESWTGWLSTSTWPL
jgi:hypothetical protein